MGKVFARIFLFGLLVFFISQGILFAGQEDEGYFLDLKQKGQLISLGLIQDKEGTWYNVWVCPGYVPPYKYAKKYFFQAGSDFAEYFHAQKYRNLARHSKNSYRWAFDDCINDFIIKGIPEAWEKYFDAASNRTKKRVFGWWFAYPWAFMESTVESIVRVPVGVTGSVLGTGWATVAVPSYYMTNSTVKGLWHLTVDTVTLPLVAGTWNTIISPPLAMIGQKPSVNRVDGFWVKTLSDEQVINLEYIDSPFSRKDIAMLEQWGTILDTELKPYDDEQAGLKNETAAAIKKIKDEAAPELKKIRDEQAQKEKLILEDEAQKENLILNEQKEKQRQISEEESLLLENLRADPDHQAMLKSLSDRGFTAARMKALRSLLRKTLRENGTADEKHSEHIVDLLIKYPPSAAAEHDLQGKKTNPLSHKTDPLRRSVEIMKSIDPPHD